MRRQSCVWRVSDDYRRMRQVGAPCLLDVAVKPVADHRIGGRRGGGDTEAVTVVMKKLEGEV